MSEKTNNTTVKMNPDDLKQLEGKLNEVAQAFGLEIFDLLAGWSPPDAQTKSKTIDVYEISILFRKAGWKRRKESPDNAQIYKQHITNKKQRHSQPSA